MPYKSMVQFLLLLSTLCFISNYALDASDLVIVILSQPNKYHLELAEKLKNNIQTQAQTLNKGCPKIHLSHIDFPHVGGWTIIPLIPKLSTLHGKNSSWIFFVEDNTALKMDKLVEILGKYNENEETWIGFGLHDREATIIHHFAFFDDPTIFKYPNIASGFAMSSKLLQTISKRLRTSDVQNPDFSIDNAHELALFVWNNGSGQTLQHEPALCVSDDLHCGSYPKKFQPCEKPISRESIYFAVKTCSKFHKDRVTVVKNTWARHATRINFYSDVQDDSIPTVSLGIPNTENGHCGKTLAIIKHVVREIKTLPDVKWIVIADDDTILSVTRLRQLLSCFNSSSAIAIGERYGYNVYSSQGYNYLTGGAGMVFSRKLLTLLSMPGKCECPMISSPDDMFLGICIARLGVSITHSSLFHQARPVDYPPEYLESQMVVSFHKHWMIDPLAVYEKWFMDVDLQDKLYQKYQHNEL